MDVAFILYAGVIPLVPLLGAQKFQRRKDPLRRNICYGLFALQLLLSGSCIAAYLAH